MALNHEILSAASNGDNYMLELALARASHEHMSNWAHPGGFEAWAKDKKEKPLLASESTALHVCAFMKQFESCRILLSHHFHTNHPNVKGCTPLMVAAAKGDAHIVHIFVTNGDHNLEKKDQEGRTALDWASTDEIREILKAGAESTVEVPKTPGYGLPKREINLRYPGDEEEWERAQDEQARIDKEMKKAERHETSSNFEHERPLPDHEEL